MQLSTTVDLRRSCVRLVLVPSTRYNYGRSTLLVSGQCSMISFQLGALRYEQRRFVAHMFATRHRANSRAGSAHAGRMYGSYRFVKLPPKCYTVILEDRRRQSLARR